MNFGSLIRIALKTARQIICLYIAVIRGGVFAV